MISPRLCRLALCLAAVISTFAVSGETRAAAHHVILCGSGGEAEYSPRFREWGTRLKDTLALRLGVAPENIHVLMEQETASAPAGTTISLESIQGLFKGLAQSLSAEDDLFVYLIGHGSYLKNASKFQIPGPDLSAEGLEALLAELSPRRTIIIAGTSASAGFINVLSGPQRVVCAASKSATEVNATEFMRFFIEALEDGSADRNRDERISVLEASEQAAALTASWYTTSTLIATEHSILDDNGDGLGSRLPIELALSEAPADDLAAVAATSPDGALADSIYLKDFSFPASAPKALIDAYLTALEEVKTLKARKGELPEADYYAQLETLLIKASRTHREIRGYADVSPEELPASR